MNPKQFEIARQRIPRGLQQPDSLRRMSPDELCQIWLQRLKLYALPVPMPAPGRPNTAQAVQMSFNLTIGGFFWALLNKDNPC